jgi:hypothetical protein
MFIWEVKKKNSDAKHGIKNSHYFQSMLRNDFLKQK